MSHKVIHIRFKQKSKLYLVNIISPAGINNIVWPTSSNTNTRRQLNENKYLNKALFPNKQVGCQSKF